MWTATGRGREGRGMEALGKLCDACRCKAAQQPRWREGRQQAPCPGMLGCWPLAGVYPEWPQFKIRTDLANVFCPNWRGAELSAGSLFSILPRASLLQEGEEEHTCWGPARPFEESISDSWGKEAGEKLHMVSSAWDKGSVPCTEGGMQDKGNS